MRFAAGRTFDFPPPTNHPLCRPETRPGTHSTGTAAERGRHLFEGLPTTVEIMHCLPGRLKE